MPDIFSHSGSPYSLEAYLQRSRPSWRRRRAARLARTLAEPDEELGRGGERGEGGDERGGSSTEQPPAEHSQIVVHSIFEGEESPFVFRHWTASHSIKKEELYYYILPSRDSSRLAMRRRRQERQRQREADSAEEEGLELSEKGPSMAIIINPSAVRDTEVVLGYAECSGGSADPERDAEAEPFDDASSVDSNDEEELLSALREIR